MTKEDVDKLADAMALEMFNKLQWTQVDGNHKPYAEGLKGHAEALLAMREALTHLTDAAGNTFYPNTCKNCAGARAALALADSLIVKE